MRRTRFGKAFQKGRKVGMNKTEQAYAVALEGKLRRGEIEMYAFESVSLKLAEGTRYTPDFMVQMADNTIEFHEVKAGRLDKKTQAVVPLSEDASKIKLKVAADKFPFRFVITFLHRGEWYSKEVE